MQVTFALPPITIKHQIDCKESTLIGLSVVPIVGGVISTKRQIDIGKHSEHQYDPAKTTRALTLVNKYKYADAFRYMISIAATIGALVLGAVPLRFGLISVGVHLFMLAYSYEDIADNKKSIEFFRDKIK